MALSGHLECRCMPLAPRQPQFQLQAVLDSTGLAAAPL